MHGYPAFVFYMLYVTTAFRHGLLDDPIFKIGLMLSIHYHEYDIRYSQIRKEKRKNKLKSDSYALHSYTLKQLFSQNNTKGVVQYIWKT